MKEFKLVLDTAVGDYVTRSYTIKDFLSIDNLDGLLTIETHDFSCHDEDIFYSKDISIIGELQYVYKNDKHGVKIFEGDIITHVDCGDAIYKVLFDKECSKYIIERIKPEVGDWIHDELQNMDSKLIEVVGNVFDIRTKVEYDIQ